MYQEVGFGSSIYLFIDLTNYKRRPTADIDPTLDPRRVKVVYYIGR